MRKLLSTAAAAAALFAGFSTSANAFVIVTLQDVKTGTYVECNNSTGLGTCDSAANGLTIVLVGTDTVVGKWSTGLNANSARFEGLTFGSLATVGGWDIKEASSTSNAPGTVLEGNINQTALVATNKYATAEQFRLDVRVFDFTMPTALDQVFSGTATVQSSTRGATVTNTAEFYAGPLNNGLGTMITCAASIAVPAGGPAQSDDCETGNTNWTRLATPFSLRDIQYFTASSGAVVNTSATITTSARVPEPASLMLVGAALLALGATARRKV